jgi:hypothetical protein
VAREQHDGIRNRVLHRLRDVLRSVRDPVSEAAMTPFLVACIHTIIISAELEVGLRLIKLRNQVRAAVK